MARKAPTVATQRNYSVLNVQSAKQVALIWLQRARLQNAIAFGLPEVDDRYHIWRVPLLNKTNRERIGEVVVDARTSLIAEDKSTTPATLEARLLGRNGGSDKKTSPRVGSYPLSSLRNTIALGDSEEVLQELPAGSADLVFTSSP